MFLLFWDTTLKSTRLRPCTCAPDGMKVSKVAKCNEIWKHVTTCFDFSARRAPNLTQGCVMTFSGMFWLFRPAVQWPMWYLYKTHHIKDTPRDTTMHSTTAYIQHMNKYRKLEYYCPCPYGFVQAPYRCHRYVSSVVYILSTLCVHHWVCIGCSRYHVLCNRFNGICCHALYAGVHRLCTPMHRCISLHTHTYIYIYMYMHMRVHVATQMCELSVPKSSVCICL